MTRKEPISRTISINFDELRAIVGVAIRRASAFARIALDELDTRDVTNFNLSAGFTYGFWPEVISNEDRIAAHQEFRSWILGSCMRELDLFYGLFLDRVWYAIEVAEKHGTKVRSDYVFDTKFSRNPNVAAKQKLVSGKLKMDDYFEQLNSLSLARNALGHNAGFVRSPHDCNSENRNALEIKWLAFDMIAGRNGEEMVVENMPFDTNLLPGDGETEISIRFTARVLNVLAGSRIELSHAQLAELCHFYVVVRDRTIDGLVAFFAAKGVSVSQHPLV